MCHKDGWVIIRNSELMCGNLCKTTMGGGTKNQMGLFYTLIRENNSHNAARCMLRIAKFSSRWISNHGMSIGISDVTPFDELIQKKKGMIQVIFKKCDDLIK